MLTKEQVALLFAFCERKHVRFYDVQVELVDHLATAIERKMIDDQAMSFEKALDDVYKGFGIFGFSHIVMEKSQAVVKKQQLKFRHMVKAQFRWPSILLVIILTSLLERLIYLNGIVVWQISLVAVFVSGFLISLFCSISLARIRKKLKKKLIIAGYLHSSGITYVPLYFFMFGLNKFDSSNWVAIAGNDLLRPLLALFVAFYMVLIIAHFRLYQEVVKDIKTGFPELLVV